MAEEFNRLSAKIDESPTISLPTPAARDFSAIETFKSQENLRKLEVEGVNSTTFDGAALCPFLCGAPRCPRDGIFAGCEADQLYPVPQEYNPFPLKAGHVVYDFKNQTIAASGNVDAENEFGENAARTSVAFNRAMVRRPAPIKADARRDQLKHLLDLSRASARCSQGHSG